MGPHSPATVSPVAYLVPLAVVALVVARNTRARQIRIETLWITPGLLLLLTLLTLGLQRPSAASLQLDAAGLIVGGLLGWWRGRLVRITVNPNTHALTSQTSPVGTLLVLGIFAVRYGLRTYAAEEASNLNIPIADVTDAFLSFAVGLVCATRLEMTLRATRLLNDARSTPRES